MKVEQTLTKAAEYIQQHGLARGILEDTSTGAVCTLGAISKVTNSKHLAYPTKKNKAAQWLADCIRAAHPQLAAVVDNNQTVICIWSDNQSRTDTEIVSFLKTAAEEYVQA